MGPGGGGEGLNIKLHPHPQNAFCLKTGSDENRFNVPLIVRVRVTRRCPYINHSLEKGEERQEMELTSSAYQSYALPLGQTGWHLWR